MRKQVFATHKELILLVIIILFSTFIAGCASQKQSVQATSQYDEARRAAQNYSGPVHGVAMRLYEQGMASYQSGRYAEAADLLGQAADVGVTNFPMRPDARIYQAMSLLKLRKYFEAYKIAHKASEQYPERWELRLIMVEYWLWRENAEQAGREMTVALGQAPEQPAVLVVAARVLRYRGDFLGAAEVGRMAVYLEPNKQSYRRLLADIYLDLGMQMEQQGNLEWALSEYFAAASYMPEDPTPPILIGRILLALSMPAAARRYTIAGRDKVETTADLRRDVFFTDLTEGDIDAEEHRRMAEFYFGRDQAEMAAQELELSLAAAPDQADAWHRLGMLHAETLGDRLRARQCLHALWVLDREGDLAAKLEQALKLNAEPPINQSPGFIISAESGAGYDFRSRRVTDAGQPIPLGKRAYLTFVLGGVAGRHDVRVRIDGPDGNALVDERFTVEFFGKDFAIVRTGSWAKPGQYQVHWWLDGVERAGCTFVLQ